MPFFSRREPEEPVRQPSPEPVEPPKRHHGLFGSHRSTSPAAASAHTASTGSSRSSMGGGHGSLHHSNTVGSTHTAGSRGRSLLHRSGTKSDPEMDPSIVHARERVMSAESAEREADRALDIARREVREAREHVKVLEAEAKEDARRARIKQHHAKEVSKRGNALGRHG